MPSRTNSPRPRRTQAPPPALRRRASGNAANDPASASPPDAAAPAEMPSPRDEAASAAGRGPHGRFAPGNSFGAEHRWQPGQSGNPSGSPSKFAELRALVQQIGNEAIAAHPQGWTQLERMLRQMYFAKSPIDHQNILEFGWGKVPTETQVSGNIALYDPSTARDELARRLARLAVGEREADVS